MTAKRRETTWADILAVALIMAVLFAVIRPAMPDSIYDMLFLARENARVSVCRSNMKIIGLAFFQYTEDYDDHEPNGSGHWAGDLYPYIKQAQFYDCPDDKTALPLDKRCSRISYAANVNSIGVYESKMADPALTVLATEYDGTPAVNLGRSESVSRSTNGVHPNTAWGNIRLGSTSALDCAPRHTESSMFLASDGHVKLLRASQVSSGRNNRSVSRGQDASHAAGTSGLATGHYVLTFSER